MKQTKHILSALAIAAVLAVMAAGCAQDDSREGGKAGTVSKVHISVGAGLDGDAATRSAVTVSGTKRTLTFTEGDKLYVNGDIDISDTESKVLAGFLTVDAASIGSEATTATFTGDLEVYEEDGDGQWVAGTHDFGGADPLAACSYVAAQLVHAGTEDGYEIIDRRVGQYKELYIVASDVSALMTSRLVVQTPWVDGYDSSNRRFRLEATEFAILNCTISGLVEGHDYSVALELDNGWYVGDNDYTGYATADANGTARFAILTYAVDDVAYKLKLIDGEKTYTVDLGAKDLTAKVYNVTKTAVAPAEPPTPTTVTLTAETGAVRLVGGEVLTGTGGTTTHVTIAEGATVTLHDANIPGRVANDDYTPWAGITCEGDATIILEGTNYVRGYYATYPGIQAGPTGTTLTIGGSGSLTATTGLLEFSYIIEGYAAGIGGGHNMQVGNIVITGGTITASGNNGGAGIGSGQAINTTASCGDITISGGNITASGNIGGAGIGSGKADNATASCGDITISGGNITTSGGNKAAGIGSGANHSGTNTCGDITISGGNITATGGWWAAGIGNGMNGFGTNTCGDITITSPATGTATGGEYSDYDIGAGNGGTCGTVSVADGTISGLTDETTDFTFTVKYYQYYEESGGEVLTAVPVYNVNEANSNITIVVFKDDKTYTTTGEFHDGSTVTINLHSHRNVLVTIISYNTGYDLSENTVRPVGESQPTADFSATVNLTLDPRSPNLGTVNLVKK